MASRRTAIPTAAAAKRASSRVRPEPEGGGSLSAAMMGSTIPIVFATVDTRGGGTMRLPPRAGTPVARRELASPFRSRLASRPTVHDETFVVAAVDGAQRRRGCGAERLD